MLRSARRTSAAIVRAAALLVAAVLPAAHRPALAARRPTLESRVLVDTLRSQSLGVRKQLVVYLPPSYAAHPARRYPVAYYLHGAWGDEWDWARKGRLPQVMDSLVAAGGPEMIVVMPDGDDGWYTTWNTLPSLDACRRDTTRRERAESYCVPWTRYDDYVARDLVAHVDSTYRTMAAREHRAVAGLSMGGYGAVTLALAYPEVWSAAASHSGVLSPAFVGPRPFPRRGAVRVRYARSAAELDRSWGGLWRLMEPAFGRDTAAWWARDPARRAARLLRERPALMPALFVDVGRGDDLVIDHNRAAHHALTRLGVAHDYREWPGGHDWQYWQAHVGESLQWIGERIR
jgi:enterochelin esterase-like enzyme